MKYLKLTLFLLTLLIALVNAGPVDKREAEAEPKPYCYYKNHKPYCPYKKHHPHKREAGPEALAESDSSDVVTEGAPYHQYPHHERGYKHGHHDHHHGGHHHGHHGHHN